MIPLIALLLFGLAAKLCPALFLSDWLREGSLCSILFFISFK